MLTKNWTRILNKVAAAVVLSGSGVILYQVYKTRYVLGNTVKADVLRQKKKVEYIYINDPQFQLLYERTHLLEEQRRTEGKKIFFLSSWLIKWNAWRKSYSRRILSMAQSEDRWDRKKSVQMLASMKTLAGSEYTFLAQLCDARTAVGLARSDGVDLRYFLKPPHSHIILSEKELVDRLTSLLLALNHKKNHACIKYFLSKAFPKLQYRHIVLDSELTSLQVPQSSFRNEDLLRLSVENLLHYSDIEDNAKDIVTLGGLPIIMALCRHFEKNIEMSVRLAGILSNISAQPETLDPLFKAGCIGVLACWTRHPNVRLSVSAARALANLDEDDTSCIKYMQRVYPLHPLVRQLAQPKLDVVFVHGLLGGAFVTWRQRDPDQSSMAVIQSSSVDNMTETLSRQVSDERTKRYLEGMAELKMEEWNMIGSDFEVVLQDCPENGTNCSEGPFSYTGCHPCIQQSTKDHNKYSVCWPRDWLPQDCHYLRVIGVNYETNLSMWGPMCPTEGVKRNLEFRSAELLTKLKLAGLGSRPVVWVAHSMGGLLVKNMLVKCWESEDEELHRMFSNTKAVVFYSVPHRGSHMVSLSQAVQLLLWPSLEVQDLKENSPALLKLHDQFLKMLQEKPVQVVSFAETKPTLISSLHLQFQFVQPKTANPGVGEFYEIPQDHLCICKPESRQSFLYQKLLNLIQHISQEADADCLK